MVDPFNSPTMEDTEQDLHAITTDHHYMKGLWLGVFTTGNLYNWYNQKYATNTPQGNKGDYKNRPLLNNASIDTILGTPLNSTENYGRWSAWRSEGATGRYTTISYDEWTY